jgi:HK97 gp10 family phage protein
MAITFGAGAGRNRFGRAITLRTVGLKKVQDDFKRIERRSDGILTKEIHQAANRIAERANRDVPVDTGRLIKSIKVEKWTLRVAVLANAPYALFVEKGTRYMKAQPYFFKHIDPQIKKLIQNVKRLIK